jgi:uncharacterized protein
VTDRSVCHERSDYQSFSNKELFMKLNYNNQVLMFSPISIGDKDAFRQMSDDVGYISCEYSFANLFMWGKPYDMQWCSFNNAPLILIARDNVLLFPLCQGITTDELQNLSKAFLESGGSGEIAQVPSSFIKEHSALEESFHICEDRDFADYIHLTAKLSLLQGKKLSKKRNLISQFTRNYPEFEDLPLSSELFSGCLLLAKNKMIDGNTDQQDELKALELGFANCADLKLDGRVIKVKGKTIAFSVFSQHIDGSYLVHYEKSDHDYKGVSQLINWKTAEFLADKCKYINREQDLGIPGLRKAKMSYDPDKILINAILQSKSY